MADELRPVTAHPFLKMKERAGRLVMLPCYAALSARLLDASGVDALLVGDSVNQVLAGAETTLSATLEQMIYHTKIVRRGAQRAMVVCDMPYLTYQGTPAEAIRNCGRVLAENGGHAVEGGGGGPIAPTGPALGDVGNPGMGHSGRKPPSGHCRGRDPGGRGGGGGEPVRRRGGRGALSGTGAFVWEVAPAPPPSPLRQCSSSPACPRCAPGAAPRGRTAAASASCRRWAISTKGTCG